MERLFEYSQTELLRYLLILARVSPLFMIAPVWGSPMVPPQLRVLIAALVAGLLLPVTRTPLPAGLGESVFSLALAVGLEMLLGLVLAYMALLLFAAAQFAGQLMDIQVGFGMASVYDPLTSAQVTIIGQLQYLAALFVFLLLDGHHLLLRGLAGTFSTAPLGHPFTTAEPLMTLVSRGGSLMFLLSAQIAAPALTALFLTNFAMGLASRMLPQINIFLVGLPVNVVAGLLAIVASLSLLPVIWRGAITGLEGSLAAVLSSVR
jgi:flagellar biosynthetic protein FliR